MLILHVHRDYLFLFYFVVVVVVCVERVLATLIFNKFAPVLHNN